jgi:hypothetical protein
MNTKTVSQLNPDGYFVFPVEADESPLEPGVFLIPARAIDVLPPQVPAGKMARWAGEWVFEDIPQADVKALARQAAKEARDAAVAAIVVTTAAGNQFDGDEVSQGRMARAIIALQATGTSSVTWVLYDNTVIQASAAELVEALALAGAAQAAIWVID